ncbi:MAG: three-Cys-motif partner protein TcmP [Mesorhizobium sp.]|nr:MAG: three-Cys-motif partner protein TcmP [Mesorhizobium sp.]
MNEVYAGREQTAAKHFILEQYLLELATITLNGGYPVLTYIDGFSGPWKSRTTDYSDTSFMIAIKVLKEVQQKIRDKGERRKIKCFFVEKNATAFAELHPAVMAHNDAANDFHVATYKGPFVDAVPEIVKFRQGIALTFIDPTGWTEYPFDKIDPILKYSPGEVLVNFMFDFASRFTSWDDPKIRASFDGILRPGWPGRIDRTMPPGMAAEKLFRKEFREAGGFDYVVSTPIKKLQERIHFCITYGTRHTKGLEVYRGVERKALRAHDFRRFESRIALVKAGPQGFMFNASDLHQTGNMEEETVAEMLAAADWVEKQLRYLAMPILFDHLWPEILENFALKKGEAKDVCCALADRGVILRTWKPPGSKRKKPDDSDWITLAAASAASASILVPTQV